jgi:hypothetical protein
MGESDQSWLRLDGKCCTQPQQQIRVSLCQGVVPLPSKLIRKVMYMGLQSNLF